MTSSSYYFFKKFGNERKIKSRTEMTEVSRISTWFFRIGIIAAVLEDAERVLVMTAESMMGESRGTRKGRQTLMRTVERGPS